MIRFPHFLCRYHSEGDSYRNEDFNWVTPEGHWCQPLPCRAEYNEEATSITLPDGTHCQPAFTIYLPADVPALSKGERIRIIRPEETYDLVVRQFIRNQLNCMVWGTSNL